MQTDLRAPDTVAAPSKPRNTVPPAFQWALFLWMSGIIYCAFFRVPWIEGLGPLSAILYFHVPMAMIGGLSLMLAAAYSALYLATRRIQWDTKACAAAELGLLISVLATVTGSMWARGAWNSWWNWDPKESSMLVLILLSGAYLALRSAVDERPLRARLSAAYALLSVVTVPLLMYLLPVYYERMGMSNHPYALTRGQMDPSMRTLLLCSMAGFFGIFLWLFRLRVAVGRALDRAEGLDE